MTVRILPSLFFLFNLFISSITQAQTPQAVALWSEGRKLVKTERYQEAIKAYEQSLKQATKTDTIWARLNIDIAIAYYRLGNNQKQKECLLKNLTVSTSKRNQYSTFNNLGLTYCILGQHDSSLFYLQKAERINVSEKLNRSAVYANLQRVYGEKGFREKELFYALKSLEIDQSNADSVRIGISMADVGEVYNKLKQTRKAEKYFREALRLAFLTKNHLEVSRAYEGLGVAKNFQNQSETAYAFFEKGLQHDQKHPNPIGEAFGYLNLALVENKQKKHAEALQKLAKSGQIFNESQYAIGIMQNDLARATALAGLKNYDAAIALLKKNVEMGKKIDTKEHVMKAYLLLAECYEQTGARKHSLAYYRLYQSVNAEQLSRENKQQTENLLAKYEGKQSELQMVRQQVVLLEKESQIRNIAIGGLFLTLFWLGCFVLYNAQQRRRLAQMQAQFAKTTQQLESFNYSVSHELKTPIVQMRQLLNKLEVKAKSIIEMVQLDKLLNDMDGLIDSMLLLSQMEREVLQRSPTNTQALVQDVLQTLNPPASVRIHYQNLPTVQADVYLLRQVFVNLIQNALKFSANEPQPVIEIAAQIADNKTIFSIKDNGIGFDASKAPYLFGLFHRLHPNSQLAGFGVGLVIVKTIVEKHGGRVWAEGEAGRGATFWFELPQ